jgi:2-keto-4-pentenoate hydratase/2-oxohepta-3-ene-1,7-dioic acid hydratase in catechol pathway
MTTADEIENPDDLSFRLTVNDEVRQDSNTKYLIFDCRKLIEYASRFYTLFPGDIIMTGTPEGVGPLEAGDRLTCEVDIIGRMEIDVR